MGKNSDPKHINSVMNDSIADSEKILKPEEAIKSMALSMQMAFIDADAYAADPFALLGQVFQIRKIDGRVPVSLNEGGFPVELTPYPLQHKVNEKSKTLQPVLRSSFIVTKQLAASVSFLNYLSAELTDDSSFSVIVFDQASGNIDMLDNEFQNNLKKWTTDHKDLMDDPDICYIFAVNAFIQKNIVRKKYVKFNGKGKAGAWGVNINGELSTGTDQYSLDMKFGLTPIVMKRPQAMTRGVIKAFSRNDFSSSALTPTKAELALFSSATGLTLKKNILTGMRESVVPHKEAHIKKKKREKEAQ